MRRASDLWTRGESWPAQSDAVLSLVGVLTETATRNYRPTTSKAPASCAGGTAQWLDPPNIDHGFWSPDNDQKQANCKERPSPQQIEIYPASPEEAKSHPFIDNKRDQTCHDQCCQRMHSDGHERHPTSSRRVLARPRIIGMSGGTSIRQAPCAVAIRNDHTARPTSPVVIPIRTRWRWP